MAMKEQAARAWGTSHVDERSLIGEAEIFRAGSFGSSVETFASRDEVNEYATPSPLATMHAGLPHAP